MIKGPCKIKSILHPAHCLLCGSLTRGFSSRLDAPILSEIDRVILARALICLVQLPTAVPAKRDLPWLRRET